MEKALLRHRYVYPAALVSVILLLLSFAAVIAADVTLAPPSQIEDKGTVQACASPALPSIPPGGPGSAPCIAGIPLGSQVEINFHDFQLATGGTCGIGCFGPASGRVKIQVGDGGEATLGITQVFSGPGGFLVIATVSTSSIGGVTPGDRVVVDVVIMPLSFGIGTGVNTELTTVTAGSVGAAASLEATANSD